MGGDERLRKKEGTSSERERDVHTNVKKKESEVILFSRFMFLRPLMATALKNLIGFVRNPSNKLALLCAVDGKNLVYKTLANSDRVHVTLGTELQMCKFLITLTKKPANPRFCGIVQYQRTCLQIWLEALQFRNELIHTFLAILTASLSKQECGSVGPPHRSKLISQCLGEVDRLSSCAIRTIV